MRLQHRDFQGSVGAQGLFGDYELLIDLALDGDKTLKATVAQADRINRGGLAVLQNALKNRRVNLSERLADILASCVADQEFWEAKQKDLSRIHQRPNGKWQVQVTVEHNLYSKTFVDLLDAQNYRDRMLLLASAIRSAE